MLNYAEAIISTITFMGACITLSYMLIEALTYINPFGMIFPGLYLGLCVFETLEIIRKKKIKKAFSSLLHHLFFIGLLIIICYDGKVHFLMGIIWLQTITNIFLHLLVTIPESNPKRKSILFMYKISFIIFRIIGVM
jgi:hypothetical protein